jgi:hypothetical protein
VGGNNMILIKINSSKLKEVLGKAFLDYLIEKEVLGSLQNPLKKATLEKVGDYFQSSEYLCWN